MTNKIKGLTIWEKKNDNYSGYLKVSIKDDDNLEMLGLDMGGMVGEFWGGEDYEYWLTIDKEHKDTILLWLIKERFDNDIKFKEWLDSKNIPSEFGNWIWH